MVDGGLWLNNRPWSVIRIIDCTYILYGLVHVDTYLHTYVRRSTTGITDGWEEEKMKFSSIWALLSTFDEFYYVLFEIRMRLKNTRQIMAVYHYK